MKNAKLGMRLNDKRLRTDVKGQVLLLRQIDPEGHTLLPGCKVFLNFEEDPDDVTVIITSVNIGESGLVFQGMAPDNTLHTFGADEIEYGVSTLRSRYVKRVMAVKYPHLTAMHDPREAARREDPDGMLIVGVRGPADQQPIHGHADYKKPGTEAPQPLDDEPPVVKKYPVEMPLPVQGVMCYDNHGAAYVLTLVNDLVVRTCLEGTTLSMQHGTSDEEAFYRLQAHVRALPQSFWHAALEDYERAADKTHLVKSTTTSFALGMMRTTNPLPF